jgi:MarR family 2-MHQ and catechol resistance regulon transcriptional repressor
MQTMNESIYKSNLTIDERVLIATVRTAEYFKRVHSSVFKKYGLSFSKYNLLRALDASSNGRSRISDVSRIMLVPNANITGVAKRLAQDEFIVKKSDPTDDRVTILEITQKGKNALKIIEKDKDSSLKIMLKGLSKKEKATLLEKMNNILKISKLSLK